MSAGDSDAIRLFVNNNAKAALLGQWTRKFEKRMRFRNEWQAFLEKGAVTILHRGFDAWAVWTQKMN